MTAARGIADDEDEAERYDAGLVLTAGAIGKTLGALHEQLGFEGYP